MTRKRWTYTIGGRPILDPVTGELTPLEVSVDFQGTRGLTAPVTDLYMDGTAATDGTDIGSRRKREEYKRTRGLIDADDLKGTWERAAQERAKYVQAQGLTREQWREAASRSLYQLEKKR